MITLQEVLELARKRKMRVSKAATRLGLNSEHAKACSVASEVLFLKEEEDLVRAARTIAHSCMSARADAYRYWARAQTPEDGVLPPIRPVGVAVYRDSRCLVREDTRQFVKCYGPQSGDLHRALVWLGWTWNVHALEDLVLPEEIRVGKERVEVWGSLYEAAESRPVFGLWTERELRYFGAGVVQTYKVWKKAPRPYCDGRRAFL